MTSEADEPRITDTYVLACNDCTFETTVEGTAFDALDVADAHQAKHGDSPVEHFVDFELDGDG